LLQPQGRPGAAAASSAPAPFAISCSCGRAVHGLRQQLHQVLPCPGCGRRLFVLPQDCWVGPTAPPAALGRRLVRVGLLAGLIALGSTAAVYVGLRPFLARPAATGGPIADAAADPASQLRRLTDDGRRALREGNFRRARRLLNEARLLGARNPAALPAAEGPHLEQLARQADLLADLLRVPLEEILRQGQRLRDEEEWQAQFADYRGRSVLFDDTVRADSRGRPTLAVYRVAAGGVTARLALEDLTLWQAVPADIPWRMLLGARLAGCGREAGGGWVFHFERDSGVLLTDRGAAAACCPVPLEPELEEVLRRQARWLGR
jgi:hypothetical protein